MSMRPRCKRGRERELDSLKLKLRKLDINAIHSFEINENDSIPKNIKVAVEGSKFIWILYSHESNLKSKLGDELILPMKSATVNKGIIVVDKTHKRFIIQQLSNQ